MNQIGQYDKAGYAVFRSFFTDEEIWLLTRHIDRIYEQWMSKHKAEIINSKLVNMHSLTLAEYFQDKTCQRLAFFKLIASEKLRLCLERMFGPEIYFHNTQLFFNPVNNECLPYWHRDMQYSNIEDNLQRDELNNMLSLHVRIPLVKEKGVEVVAGSHKRWDTELERNVRFELGSHKNSDSLPNSELIDLAPGDILIFNAQMIHRGHYRLNQNRKAFDLCVGTYHPLSSAFLDPKVLPTEEEMQKIEHNKWYDLARKIVIQHGMSDVVSS